MYHLVLKGLERCNLQGQQLLPVMNFMTTFKETVYSWMTVGSIENEKEFLDSKVWLEVWLEGHRTNESQLADIRHNAAVLQDCDEKPPSPQGEMAGVSQTRPSQLVAAVHLCTRGHESHDQDKIQRSCYPLHVHVAIICHNGPAERDQIGREKKDCHEKSSVICSMGYWSETVDHVTDTCESEGQKKQSGKILLPCSCQQPIHNPNAAKKRQG